MTTNLISRRAFIAAAGATAAANIRDASDLAALAEPVSGLPDKGGLGPWDYWRSSEGRGIIRVASAAILGANPYNTQPWFFRLGANRIEVIADEKRNLGSLDPYRRELHMGLGCAIENACVAAPSQGLSAKVTLLPNGSSAGPAAILEFEPAAAVPHPHHEVIARRHTHRAPYQRDRKVEAGVLDALTRQPTVSDVKVLLIDALGKEGKIFADLDVEATQRISSTSPLKEARHAGLRLTAPSGSDTSDAALQKVDVNWVESTRKVTCDTAPMFGLIMVRGSRADHRLHLEAGRVWQRVHLEGTARGVALQPINHHIEVIDHEAFTGGSSSMAARMELDAAWKGWEPIFGFRVGYADSPARPSGRRPLSAVVIS